MTDIRAQIAAEIAAGRRYPVILIDPPWRFLTRSAKGDGRSASKHYRTMTIGEIMSLPIADLGTPDVVLNLWTTWPHLAEAMEMLSRWGFKYKTCAFDWMKADGKSLDLFDETIKAAMKMGYWTRSNSEPCLLATRGKPKRRHADVRMGIIEPARQHSRKPDVVHSRIERLVAGPYLELFGRTERKGWTVLGDEVGKFRGAPGIHS